MIPLEKLRRIRAVILDIDGVLTDGRVGYDGERKIKFFNYRDGHWIKLGLRAGLLVGALSGAHADANAQRANELGFSFLREGVKDKLAGFEELLADLKLAPEECLYIGDDVVDMPPMRRAGVAVAVQDAVPELDEVADWRTVTPGGRGAVREVMHELLAAQGKLDQVLEAYRR